MRPLLIALAATWLVACGVAETLPPPPDGVAAVSVAPVENKTGSPLAISGDTFVGKWIGREKRSVPDVLARELETALRDRGFAVGGPGAARLKIQLARFEPDQPSLTYVSVALTATLTDADGTVRWTGERSAWVVSTGNAVSLPAAYEAASHAVARGVVDGWQPAH